MKKKFSTVIFDLDGTLVDAYQAITASFNDTMRELGLAPLDPRVIRACVGWGDRQLLLSRVGRRRLARAIRIYRRRHAEDLTRGVRFLPGALHLLRYCRKKGLRLAIASNRPTKFTKIILRRLKMVSFFQVVLCADRVRQGKPAPDILNVIMKKLSVSRDTSLYVGDMVIDAQAARNARIPACIVTTGSSSRAEIKREKPWKIIRSLKALERVL